MQEQNIKLGLGCESEGVQVLAGKDWKPRQLLKDAHGDFILLRTTFVTKK
jgi:hypothetical protein